MFSVEAKGHRRLGCSSTKVRMGLELESKIWNLFREAERLVHSVLGHTYCWLHFAISSIERSWPSATGICEAKYPQVSSHCCTTMPRGTIKVPIIIQGEKPEGAATKRRHPDKLVGQYRRIGICDVMQDELRMHQSVKGHLTIIKRWRMW